MSKNIPCEEIQQLKRANFWLCKDRILVTKVMKDKLDQVVELNKQMGCMPYTELKDATKTRNRLLDEHGLFVDLYMRINQDIYDNGIKIMKLREGVK